MLLPSLLTAVATLLVVALAARFRTRQFATFLGILLVLGDLVTAALAPRLGPAWPAAYALLGAAHVYYISLVWPAPRPLWFRLTITWPGLVFMAGAALAVPWAVAAAFGWAAPLWWLPWAGALIGWAESMRAPFRTVDIVLDRTDAGPALQRASLGGETTARPLRVVQITDPHLGPFMSADRLHRICARAVAAEPDLVLLTGDFLTMESQADPGLLTHGLAPLRALPGRVFACRGNHDLEAPRTVATALDAVGARLLNDEEVTVETAVGPVQILGFDFVWRDREAHVAGVLDAYPRRGGHARIALLHDPGAFRHLDPDAVDLVLSGHTHGGQLGLLRLGLPWTIVSLVSDVPDHGLFSRGRSRLYVHRGTGHYGFPVRLGVPAEQGVLHIHLRRNARDSA